MDILFASPPRTGTTWFCHAMYELGYSISRTEIHTPRPDSASYRVTMARHPCDWLLSYYSSIYPGRVGVACVDIFSDRRSLLEFVDFVEHYLEHLPGCIGQMFDAYAAHSYLRLEDLPLSFFEFAEGLGFDNYRNAAKIEVRNAKRPVSGWYPDLWQAVMEAESDYVDRFDYEYFY